MAPPIRKTNFVPQWIDMTPSIPVPKIDWIERKQLDIAYGDDPLQRYDLYYPDGDPESPLPVVVIVHGGGFTHMDKRDWHLYPGFFALKEGFALISVNYRLAPKNRWPDGENDLIAAIRHIKEHAAEYHLDGDRLCLYGTSAGGNLVSIVGLKGHNIQADYAVCAIAALCPFLSFMWVHEDLGQGRATLMHRILFPYMYRSYFGGRMSKVMDKMKLASAESHIGETNPPFYLQNGTKDPAVDYRHVSRFHDLLLKAGNATADNLVLDLLDGAPHAGAGPDYLEEHNIQPILAFFKKQFNEREESR